MTSILPKLPRGWRRTVRAIVSDISGMLVVFGGLFLAETAIAQPFIVPSGSMEPTLQVGDEIVASKFAYGYSKYSLPIGSLPGGTERILSGAPRRSDIIVFRFPGDPSQTWVKRVIGLPGDRVRVTKGELYLNDVKVPRSFVGRVMADENGHDMPVTEYSETLPGGTPHAIYKISDLLPQNDTKEFAVPAGHYFVMGDNRDNSLDSRFSQDDGGVGFLPAANVVGQTDFVAYSIHPLTGWSDFFSHPWNLRFSRVLTNVD